MQTTIVDATYEVDWFEADPPALGRFRFRKLDLYGSEVSIRTVIEYAETVVCDCPGFVTRGICRHVKWLAANDMLR